MVAAEFSILREYSTESDIFASVTESGSTMFPICSILHHAIRLLAGTLIYTFEDQIKTAAAVALGAFLIASLLPWESRE